MFRCDNCGSGYSAQAASSWTSCPRCLAKERVQSPLTFELGWQRQGSARPSAGQTAVADENRRAKAA
jgi:DNA-directed RNA polymerase subunit RPC12/RpoP